MRTDFLARLSPGARILDTGGWFIPLNEATHVVDLMPYETRGGILNLNPLPGECFTKETWHQADFLDSRLRLPFPDKYFDYSVCGHTIEDLTDPRPLLAELRRVSSAGYIETPSRLSEQTMGTRDRMTAAQGHPHHHWIVEAENGHLALSAKKQSVAGLSRRHALPLRTYEKLITQNRGSPVLCFYWENDFEVIVLPDTEVARRSEQLVENCSITVAERVLDSLVRNLRRLKHGLFHSTTRESENWWESMLTLSRPYSRLPL